MAVRQLSLGDELLRLLEQSVWANRQWIEFVYSRPDPETRPKELLAHIMLAERIWLDRVEGRPESSTAFDVLEKERLLRGLDENQRAFRELAASRLGDVIHFRRATGEEYHAPVVDILHHFLTHGYHHRGQIASYYGARNVAYPNTDHINYLIENRL